MKALTSSKDRGDRGKPNGENPGYSSPASLCAVPKALETEAAGKSRNPGTQWDSNDDALRFITGNVVSFIKSLPGASDPLIESSPPCTASDFDDWEERNAPFRLPADLKNFYSVTNGLKLRWFSQAFHKKRVQPPNSAGLPFAYSSVEELAGSISIKEVQDIERLPLESGSVSSNLFTADAAFAIENISGYGTVALVYGHHSKLDDIPAVDINISEKSKSCSLPSTKEEQVLASRPTVWFQDRVGQWHKLTDDFSSYFRLLIVHLGIVGWQYVFTDEGICAKTKLLARRFIPERFAVNGMGPV